MYTGLWCDDISFCQEQCERMDCPRNSKNIRDKTVPHSYIVGRPEDCPKTPQIRNEEKKLPIVRELLQKDETTLKVALMYAEQYLKYGCDVTEKWNTAVCQALTIHRAEERGYRDAMKNIVPCSKCKHYHVDKFAFCDLDHKPDGGNWFCADAERKEE